MGLLNRYFHWLQKDAPAGEVEKYPVVNSHGETSIRGIYIIGDLTGIPLLKLAAESGKKIIDHIISDKEFNYKRKVNTNEDLFDIIIIGAGPAGIAAAIESGKNNLKFCVLESAKKFNTIINFPKGKPIFAEPVDLRQDSPLKINDGTKESLLEDLVTQINDKNLNVVEDTMVEKIEKSSDHFNLITNKGAVYKSQKVILAIGKSGNSRQLKVPGENLPKVFNRLFDPADATDHDVLIVGGGDSAIETAIATAEYARSVNISYRKEKFDRPKQGNLESLNKLIAAGKVKPLMNTTLKSIEVDHVIIKYENGKEESINNTMVFTMIGKELPVQFFKRSGIKMEGELTLTSKLQFLSLILISGVIYFGKSSADFFEHFFGKIENWGEAVTNIFSTEFLYKFFTLPAVLFSALFSESTRIWNVTKYINASIVYLCVLFAVVLGIYLFIKFVYDYRSRFKLNWQTFKYAYIISLGFFFVIVFSGERYFGVNLFGKSQSFYYTGFYSLTILIFGLRRIYVKPTRYIKYQTWSLILIQVFPLFILPEFIFPWLGSIGALGEQDGYVLTQIFPGESYWRSYGFILAWPLNFANLYPYGNNISTFWLLFSIFQTFVFIPYIVYRWGKGAYCGWICSCGAMAETLGDEYRTLAPHGAKAKKWENFGQWALLSAFVITGLKLTAILFNFEIPIIHSNISYAAQTLQKFYYIGIDVIFAGVLGVGVYFFLSGRIWCRFGCPLAALMHIYSRFSKFRIFAEKKKCISCNICTKVCHMGIDVMNYANKGIPMNDVECVRCSACVVNCPTEVLTFGSITAADTYNDSYKKVQPVLIDKSDWRSGLL
jgi:thioredoxin reductase/ferredoxin